MQDAIVLYRNVGDWVEAAAAACTFGWLHVARSFDYKYYIRNGSCHNDIGSGYAIFSCVRMGGGIAPNTRRIFNIGAGAILLYAFGDVPVMHQHLWLSVPIVHTAILWISVFAPTPVAATVDCSWSPDRILTNQTNQPVIPNTGKTALSWVFWTLTNFYVYCAYILSANEPHKLSAVADAIHSYTWMFDRMRRHSEIHSNSIYIIYMNINQDADKLLSYCCSNGHCRCCFIPSFSTFFFHYSIKSFTILRRLPKVNGKSSETYVIYLPANYERYNGNNNDENTANCLYISAR